MGSTRDQGRPTLQITLHSSEEYLADSARIRNEDLRDINSLIEAVALSAANCRSPFSRDSFAIALDHLELAWSVLGRALGEALKDIQAEVVSFAGLSGRRQINFNAVGANAAELLQLPWEAAILSDESMPLLYFDTLTITRAVSSVASSVHPGRNDDPSTLVAIAWPDGLTAVQELDIDRELNAVARGTGGLAGVTRIPANLAHLRMFAEGGSFDLAHISCHGQAGVVLLEGPDGALTSVAREELVGTLCGPRSSLQCVLLSACESGAAGKSDEGGISGSLAAELVRAGLACALGMRESVSDSFATNFAETFHDLFRAHPDRTFADAASESTRLLANDWMVARQRGQVQSLPGDWFAPIVYEGREYRSPVAPPKEDRETTLHVTRPNVERSLRFAISGTGPSPVVVYGLPMSGKSTALEMAVGASSIFLFGFANIIGQQSVDEFVRACFVATRQEIPMSEDPISALRGLAGSFDAGWQKSVVVWEDFDPQLSDGENTGGFPVVRDSSLREAFEILQECPSIRVVLESRVSCVERNVVPAGFCVGLLNRGEADRLRRLLQMETAETIPDDLFAASGGHVGALVRSIGAEGGGPAVSELRAWLESSVIGQADLAHLSEFARWTAGLISVLRRPANLELIESLIGEPPHGDEMTNERAARLEIYSEIRDAILEPDPDSSVATHLMYMDWDDQDLPPDVRGYLTEYLSFWGPPILTFGAIGRSGQ